ncbi:hypothetical protein O181_080802 [Austropuccinia psidii MF-1]|uniref:Uncharacterized protein n=1 Tax=Austropuccinia psidii MF-1 TaxID=1389203 RepID=A0A9Q3FMB2_9BASI|nr:hypothetical protein [Austropuccinia psidii MF-1]
MVPKTSSEDENPEIPVLNLHQCERTSNSANNSTKKTKINEVQVTEEAQCSEEKKESDQNSAISDDTRAEYYPNENITAFFEMTEFHPHLLQSSEYFYNLINIQEARMCKPKPSRGNVYTPGAFSITSILSNDA